MGKNSALTMLFVTLAMTLLSSMFICIPTVSASPETYQLMVYRCIPPIVNSLNVSAIATGVFGIADPSVEDGGNLFIVNNSRPRYLEVYKPSGSIWYYDASKMYNESYAPELPSPELAKNISESFLIQKGLKPDEAYFNRVGESETVVFNGNQTKATVNSRDVIYSFSVGGGVFEGPGAKIRVSLGGGGEVIGVHWVWRQLEQYNYFPAMTETEAVAKFEEEFGGDLVNLTVRLVWWGEPEFVAQQYAQPYYVFDGYTLVGTELVPIKTQRMPATLFSPTASIVLPVSGSRFLVNESILFTANVSGGMAPYTYTWESNVDDRVLYSGPSESFATADLSVGNTRTGCLLPHAIKLRVSDANGNEATDYIWIVITFLIGDLNGDTKVDIKDIALAAYAFGSVPGTPRWNFIADINNDNKIDIKDIATCAKQFGMIWTPAQMGSSQLSIDMPEFGFAFMATPLGLGLSSLLLAMAAGSLLLKKRRKGLTGLMLATIILTSIFVSSMIAPVSAQSYDDATLKEVGVEWVNAYTRNPRLSNCDDDAKGFKNALVGDAWTARFDWGDTWAWEEDFKYRNGPGGGTDYVYIDAVDFAYFAGHGSVGTGNKGRIWFERIIDYESLSSDDARWGGTTGGQSTESADLEWIVLDACLTLKETYSTSYDVFDRWRQAFKGLHYLLGFHTTCGDTGQQGPTFANTMLPPGDNYNIRESWIRSTQSVQSSSVQGAYLRAGNTLYDDINPWNVAADPPGPSYGYGVYMRWSC